MQDDLTIPSPTYRIARHSHGGDQGTRRLTIIAAGIGIGLIGVIGSWHLVAGNPHEVPLVQADPQPLRVRPANPGGLRIAGMGNDIFYSRSATDVEKLAPLPQQPDPQALQALTSTKPNSGLFASSTLSQSAPSSPATRRSRELVKPSAAMSAANFPHPRPGQSTNEPSQSGFTPPPASIGVGANGSMDISVQLAALPSEGAAHDEWNRLMQRWPDFFSRRQPSITQIWRNGKIFWRLRTAGFPNLSEANAFCQRLHAGGVSCSVANF